MYAPQATVSLQQKLQRQLMELPQVLDLLRQSPDIPLDCLDDLLTQRFFRHFSQNHALPPYRDWETDRKSTRLNSSH